MGKWKSLQHFPKSNKNDTKGIFKSINITVTIHKKREGEMSVDNF